MRSGDSKAWASARSAARMAETSEGESVNSRRGYCDRHHPREWTVARRETRHLAWAGVPRCTLSAEGESSGRVGIRMADGTEFELGPGDVNVLPPGHDSWVIGDEPVEAIDWGGAHVGAKPAG